MKSKIFVVLSVLLMAASAFAGTLSITNAGFEDGTDGSAGAPGWADSAPTPGFWTVADNNPGSTPDPTEPSEGSLFLYANRLAGGAGSQPSSSTLSQTITLSSGNLALVQAGAALTLTFDYFDSDMNDPASVSVTFLDASDNPVGTATTGTLWEYPNGTVYNAVTAPWLNGTLVTGTIDTSATKVRIEINTGPRAGGSATNLAYDNFTGSIAPVPYSDSLNIDFTPTGGMVQSGWEGYFATQEVLSSFTTQSYSVFGTTVSITPTWVSGAVNAAAQMVDRNGDDGTDAESLLRDWIGTDARVVGDPVTLTIEGLPAGNYIWKSYHHDTHDQTGLFNVTVNGAAGSVETIGVDISSTMGDGITHLADATAFYSSITSNGADPVTLEFDCQNSSGHVSTVFFVMNGFVLFRSSKAAGPVPADGVSGVSVSTDLSWMSPTEYTPTSYDVYFGTNSDVYSNPKYTVYTNSYSPPSNLLYGTTYYWVVDSNDDGTPYPGDQWSFATTVPASPSDHVVGNLMLMNENAGWCWYQDEKIIYDPVSGDVITSTTNESAGFGGTDDVETTVFDLATGKRTRNYMDTRGGDDHNMGALWIRPDGKYLHIDTGHNDRSDNSYCRTTVNPNDGTSWSSEYSFNWVTLSGLPAEDGLTYHNLHYLSAEGTGNGRLYNISREFDRSPCIVYSDDWGDTWAYAGKLSVPNTGSSYSNGYYKYASNGVDRIDFIATEHHPRDYNNSIYHGYVQGGKSYDSFGNEIDGTIFDNNAPGPEEFTQIFAAGPIAADQYHTAWTIELELDESGYPVCLFITRYGIESYGANDGRGAADHRIFYARFNGSSWTYTELSKIGQGLESWENDYTGLGCIHPENANLIYISTPFDPRDNTEYANHEIFRGVTDDNGSTWQWTQITFDSTVDNLRPAIPSWDANNTALFWLRGYYPAFGGNPQADYDQVLVGMIDRQNEAISLVTYIDADPSNTTESDSTPFTPTGPSDSAGAADDQWHEYTEYGNAGSCYTANEMPEDAPMLKTTISGLSDGTYDVFAYFWCHPSEDWGVVGGFTPSDILYFNRQSSQHTEASEFFGSVSVIDTEALLYRVYIGRREVTGGAAIDVYIDDYDSSLINGADRAVYDGVGVASVIPDYDGDIYRDGKVDLKDVSELGRGWQTVYDMNTLTDIANDWLLGI